MTSIFNFKYLKKMYKYFILIDNINMYAYRLSFTFKNMGTLYFFKEKIIYYNGFILSQSDRLSFMHKHCFMLKR